MTSLARGMDNSTAEAKPVKRTLLVLTSTYPRWTDDPEPGFVHELSKRLVAEFHVVVLGPHAPGAKTRESLDGIEVVRYRYAPVRLETLVNDGGIVTNLRRSPWKYLLVPTFVLMQFFAAWRLVRRENIEAIHAHWLLPQGLIAAALGFTARRTTSFVVTSHGADLYALNGWVLNALKRFVLRRASAATVVSRSMLDRLGGIGADTGKVSVLPMGVDLTERFTPDPSVLRSQDEILFVGRLVEKKGLQYLIEAMPLVLQSAPHARLTIAGFGPEEAALRKQVERLGLESTVTFLGAVQQTELPSLYRRAALFVAPFVQADSGDQEGLPVALMEAVACGCPVIAGHVPGIDDLLGNLTSELCVDARDLPALAVRIVAGLAHPDTERARALRVRDTASAHVDWARIARGYVELLRQGIRGSRR